MNVLLAQPRGFCAGVARAVDIAEQALERFGAPVYVYHEIVHNGHVVRDLASRGAIFVDDIADIPEGAVTVFSAHGVAKSVVEEANRRHLQVTSIGLFDYRFRYAMRAEYGDGTFWDVGNVVDKDGASGCEIANDMTVMHDLVIDVHRSAEALQRLLGDIDRPRNTRAKAAGLCEQYVHQPATVDAISLELAGFTALADLASGATGAAAGAAALASAAAPSVASGIGFARCSSG